MGSENTISVRIPPELKAELEAKGVVFASKTDTEVIAHLAESYLDEGPEAAVLKTLERLQG